MSDKNNASLAGGEQFPNMQPPSYEGLAAVQAKLISAYVERDIITGIEQLRQDAMGKLGKLLRNAKSPAWRPVSETNAQGVFPEEDSLLAKNVWMNHLDIKELERFSIADCRDLLCASQYAKGVLFHDRKVFACALIYASKDASHRFYTFLEIWRKLFEWTYGTSPEYAAE